MGSLGINVSLPARPAGPAAGRGAAGLESEVGTHKSETKWHVTDQSHISETKPTGNLARRSNLQHWDRSRMWGEEIGPAARGGNATRRTTYI